MHAADRAAELARRGAINKDLSIDDTAKVIARARELTSTTSPFGAALAAINEHLKSVGRKEVGK